MTGPNHDDMRGLIESYDRVALDASGAYICAKLQGATYRMDLVEWTEDEAVGSAEWSTFKTYHDRTARATVRALHGTKRVR